MICSLIAHFDTFINLFHVFPLKTIQLNYRKFTSSSLLVIYPFPFVNFSICPVHFSISVFQIIRKVSFINVSILPLKNSITLFFVLSILTLIFITIPGASFPNSFSTSHSALKVSLKIASNSPVILSISMRFSHYICAFIRITI